MKKFLSKLWEKGYQSTARRVTKNPKSALALIIAILTVASAPAHVINGVNALGGAVVAFIADTNSSEDEKENGQ